jgi:hypothetical protein
VYLNPSLALDLIPLDLELLLHLSPQHETVGVDLLNAGLGLLLEQKQPEPSLDKSSLLHEELQLVVGGVRFVHAPVLLNAYGC